MTDDAADTGRSPAMRMPHRKRFTIIAAGIIYAFTVAAFLDDLFRANTLAYGIIYTPMVSTALLYRARSAPWLLAALASAMVVIGACFPVIMPDLPDLIANRVLSVLAILATAFFVRQARNANDRLTEQTRRAEAAERAKSELLDSLGQEMRTPLHGVLGVLGLMLAEGGGDQREALSRVRGSVQQLLASIDNLIDLTRLKHFEPKPTTFDVGVLVYEAIDRARPAAQERQVALILDDPAPHEPAPHLINAVADPWAVDRILDNLLAHAIRITPAGTPVRLSLGAGAEGVTIAVTDAGTGFHQDLDAVIAAGHDLPLPSVSGSVPPSALILCLRLAQAMNGRLTVCAHPGAGSTVSLWLPP